MEPALKRILMVEDEEDIRTVAMMALRHVGHFEVEACASGDEALRRIDTYRPDLVLLDAMMPGLDGLSTLEALRDRPSTMSLPVAFMTARVQPHELDHYHRLGVVGVLSKPFDPMTLADELRALWRTYHESRK